jgi:hypothetical protein
MLKVEGLKAARYEVAINGATVATLSNEDLAKGFNLAAVSTPGAAQATQVLDLVFKKNSVYFERWRKVQLANGPAERLAELDKQIADLEAQINAARQPKSVHFQIKPVIK